MPRRHIAQLGLAERENVRARAAPPAGGPGAHAYPRPLLQRDGWTNLNGTWEFAIDPDARLRQPSEVTFGGRILVPFAPETPRSGVGDTGLFAACWYRREIELAAPSGDERVLLHFGAVDYRATVWVDGQLAARHEGGYTPFTADVTRLAAAGTAHAIVVRAEDDPADLAKPRGKQDWQLHPHSIWYPRTSGIWQTVWIERVGRASIRRVRWTPHLADWAVALDVLVDGAVPRERLWLHVRLHVGDVLFADDRYAVVAGEIHRRIALSDPGIDDFRNEFLWSPGRPTLVEAELELKDDAGRVLDAATSYTALRSFAADGGRFVLNGRPYPLRMVLDQGYWPETGMTAPDDEALRRDVELTKALGFNGARKHQKIEDPRYLFWADRLGLLVWEEMPSAYRFTQRSIKRVTRQWIEVLKRDAGHPCIVAWVPLNESWGVPNLPESRTERHYVEALYHLTKTLDPTRPVVGNDGWESVATDVLGIHDYDDAPERLRARYATPDLLPTLLKHERPGGRVLTVDGHAGDLPVVLSEFGGIAVSPDVTGYGAGGGVATWGYSAAATTGDLAARYLDLLAAVRACRLFAGFCYTQLTDTYQEANGLLRADRTPKVPLNELAAATTGEDRDRTALPADVASGAPREGAP